MGTLDEGPNEAHEPERGKALPPELAAELAKLRRSRGIEIEM